MSDHFVYVLRCADDTLYTGYTTDVDRRVAEHDVGEGAKYTRGRTPVELVHVEAFGSQSAAMRREHEIKSLSREGKEGLIAKGQDVEGGESGESDEPAESDDSAASDGQQ